jgi:LysM repeat protein
MEERRTSAAARIVAVLALIGAVIVIVIAVSAAMNSGSSNSSHHGKHHAQKQTRHRTKAKTYTVQPGDTLTAIAHETGVPVSEIMALNPEVDPQILRSGEVLKLK